MAQLKDRLRQLRTEHKLTQKDVANLLNISESAYGYYEQGRNEPSLASLKILANRYNVSVSYITGESNVPSGLTEKDEQDIAKRMEKIKKDLMEGNAGGEGLSFKGEPMSKEAMESLLESLEILERQTTLINKKFIPKKHRDNQ